MAIRLQIVSVLLFLAVVRGQLCPWQNDHPELASACLCAGNLARELSVQCDLVEWSLLLGALQRHLTPGPGLPVIDLLYVSNSSIRVLPADVFAGVRRIRSLQLSGCRIEKVETSAFRGHETSLRNLNLQVCTGNRHKGGYLRAFGCIKKGDGERISDFFYYKS
jgi:hypothetical protein